MMMLNLAVLMATNMCAMKSLFGWLYREEGCLTWLKRRYILFTLSVNMNMFVFKVLVCSTASRSAYTLVVSMLG